MDNDADWYCDHCGAYMNDQPGFTTITNEWRCTECGRLNDVGEGNLFDLLDMLERGIDEFRPHIIDEGWEVDD